MLKQILLASAAVWAVTLPALAQDAETAPAEDAVEPATDVSRDSVVATVNGTDITLGEVIAAAARLPAEYQQLPPDFLFDAMIGQLIQQQLLADTLDDMPARVAISLANEERSLMAGEAVNDFLAGAVTEEDVQARYDETYNAETAQTEYSAAHILVATAEEADAVLERLNAGEDFAAVAQELSTDTGSGAAGGELGWFTPDMMVEPFGTTVTELEPGVLSAPVETQFGFHIIRVNESRQQELPPIDAVRPQIEGELQQEAIEAHVAALEAESDVTRAEAGAFDPALLGALDMLED